MNVDEIIAALDSQDDALPQKALEEAMARPGELTEPLLGLVRAVIDDPAKTLDPDNNSMGYVIALYLLAQFRQTRALPLAVEVLSLDGVDMGELFGDMLVEDMARVLASVSGDDWSPLKTLIENPEVDARVRASALDALFCRVYSELSERGEMVDYLGELFRGKLERRPSEVWTALVETASNLGPEELYEEIGKAHDEGLLVGHRVDFLMEQVDDNLTFGREMGSPRIADTGAHFLIGNTLEEIGGRLFFSPPAG